MNDADDDNGKMRMYLDGKKTFTIGGLKYRKYTSLKPDTLYFSTFFGGSDMSWASTREVFTYYKNFKVLECTKSC